MAEIETYAIPDFGIASKKEIPYVLNDFTHYFFHHMLEEVEQHFLPFLNDKDKLEAEIKIWLDSFAPVWVEYVTPDVILQEQTAASWLFHFLCFLGEEFLIEELKAQKQEIPIVFSPWNLLNAESEFGKHFISQLGMKKQQKLSITIKSEEEKKNTNYLLTEEELLAVIATLVHFANEKVEIYYLNFKILPEYILQNYLYESEEEVQHDYYFHSHGTFVGFEDNELFLQGISLASKWFVDDFDIWQVLKDCFYGRNEENRFLQLALDI